MHFQINLIYSTNVEGVLTSTFQKSRAGAVILNTPVFKSIVAT